MIEETAVYDVYTADGIQTQWQCTFPYLHEEDVELYISHNGILSKIDKALYSFNVETNIVTYPTTSAETTVPKGDKVLIWRKTAITQEEDSSLQSFKSNDIERMVDKLTTICQELDDRLSRCLSYNPTEDEGETSTQRIINELKAYREDSVRAAEEATASKTSAAISASNAATSASNAASSANTASTKKDETVSAATKALTDISSSRSAALTDIGTARSTALIDINNTASTEKGQMQTLLTNTQTAATNAANSASAASTSAANAASAAQTAANDALGSRVDKTGDTMTGALKTPTPEAGSNDMTVATTAWVRTFTNTDITGLKLNTAGKYTIASGTTLTQLSLVIFSAGLGRWSGMGGSVDDTAAIQDQTFDGTTTLTHCLVAGKGNKITGNGTITVIPIVRG